MAFIFVSFVVLFCVFVTLAINSEPLAIDGLFIPKKFKLQFELTCWLIVDDGRDMSSLTPLCGSQGLKSSGQPGTEPWPCWATSRPAWWSVLCSRGPSSGPGIYNGCSQPLTIQLQVSGGTPHMWPASMHTLPHTHTHTCTLSCVHTCIYSDSFTTHTYTHSLTHSHACIHEHLLMITHTQSLPVANRHRRKPLKTRNILYGQEWWDTLMISALGR